MGKIVKAVAPFIRPEPLNFKTAPFLAWVKNGGQLAKTHYPWRIFHGFAFRYELPSFYHLKSKTECRLRFVQSISLKFDTFPDYTLYEIIPLFWDVWPDYFDMTYNWIEKHHIRTAIFTSSQVAKMMKERFPSMNILTVTEGIDVEKYDNGVILLERTIDFLEYGRNIDKVVRYHFDNMNVVRGQKEGKNLLTSEQLRTSLQNAKVVAAYPKSWTNPEQAGHIETLTQRYWEGMLSRCVMIGHAPKELTDLIGYNPVIEVDLNNPDKQLESVLYNIDNYQQWVDKNRETALKLSDWTIKMSEIREWLCSLGYDC